MSSQLSAQAIPAQTAITRMSIRWCSILPWQRGSSTPPRCRTRLSMDMILSSQPRGHVIIHQARARDRNFMRLPCLTPKEVERLIATARQNQYGHRDATMILVAYRHGLRVAELCALRWDMLELAQGHLQVRRLKNGRPSVHTVRGSELRALRRLQREQAPPSP